VIRWEHHPEEKEFSKKYRSLAMPRLDASPEIHELITESPVPDLTSIIERGNIIALRSVMEQHALIDMPFDQFFAAAEKIAGQTAAKQAKRPADEEEASAAAPAAPAPAARSRRTTKSNPKQPDYPPGTVMLPCDACKVDMAEDDTTCWNCGAKYEVEEEQPPKPAPKAAAKPAQKPLPKGEPDFVNPPAPKYANFAKPECPDPEADPAAFPVDDDDLPF
jgi:hypothetical protein